MNATVTPCEHRVMWPLPCVSSTRTTLPGLRRWTAPSLVSNSIKPLSTMPKSLSGGLCRPTSWVPAGTVMNCMPVVPYLLETCNGSSPAKITAGCCGTSISSKCDSPSGLEYIRRSLIRWGGSIDFSVPPVQSERSYNSFRGTERGHCTQRRSRFCRRGTGHRGRRRLRAAIRCRCCA